MSLEYHRKPGRRLAPADSIEIPGDVLVPDSQFCRVVLAGATPPHGQASRSRGPTMRSDLIELDGKELRLEPIEQRIAASPTPRAALSFAYN